MGIDIRRPLQRISISDAPARLEAESEGLAIDGSKVGLCSLLSDRNNCIKLLLLG